MTSQVKNTPFEQVIDENLHRVYGEVVYYGIPDRFTSLLIRLGQQDVDKEPFR